MYFATLNDFINMNGHGIYVWAAYGIGCFTLTLLIWLPIQRHRKLRRALLQHSAFTGHND
jgi:heme exporter protein D